MVEEALVTLPDNLPTDPTNILIGLDLDGTLLTSEGASPRVRATFQQLTRVGGHPLITTGRTLGATIPIFRMMEAGEGDMIASNGAIFARSDDSVELGAVVTREFSFAVDSILDRAVAAVPGATIGVEKNGGFILQEGFPLRGLIEVCQHVPLEELRGLYTPNLVIRAEHLPIEEFVAALDDSDLRDTHEVYVGWESWANVSAQGVTKASGLERYAADHGIDAAGTIAIGDGANDVPMLEWANFGVAMGAANDEVRAAGNFTTAAVENDGAAAVMQAVLIHCGVTDRLDPLA